MLWLAREGSYIREAKDAKTAVGRIVDAWNAILEHDKEIRILGEAKPNEPMDQAYLPTVGHMIGVAYKTIDPSRSGVLIESAHSILAGLDPADDMAYALYHDKLWSVHLNDQNGLKYDQDKVFGSVDLRRAFNTIWTLEKNGYGRNGECVGLDVKAMRTTTFEESMFHLSHSKTVFLRLLDIVRGVDAAQGRGIPRPSPIRAVGDADPQHPDGWLSGRASRKEAGQRDVDRVLVTVLAFPQVRLGPIGATADRSRTLDPWVGFLNSDRPRTRHAPTVDAIVKSLGSFHRFLPQARLEAARTRVELRISSRVGRARLHRPIRMVSAS